MTFRIRHIATRFALLLALAAVVPLVAYGLISILSLQQGTHDSVVEGNQNVATRAAEEIRRYIVTNADLLKALAADLQNTGLDRRQQDQILKNYVLEFREFREITLFAEDSTPVVSSRVGKPRLDLAALRRDSGFAPDGSTAPPHPASSESRPDDARTHTAGAGPVVTVDGVMMSTLRVDEELLPTSTFAVRLTHLGDPAGWLAGEFNLEEMWRMVDQIRIGAHGFAMVIAPGGALVAHGDPDKKAWVAQARNLAAHPLVIALRSAAPQPGGGKEPVSLEYAADDGSRQLGVAAAIPQLGWIVAVEQPTAEAYANAAVLQRQLVAAISIALLGMIAVGYFFGRSFINPILALQRATQSVASGKLETRVDVQTRDEIGELGTAFNTMAGRLAELQEDVKKQERQAMFGRVAAGLVHDLLHPIQNVGNNTRLLLRDDVDAETRQDCGRIIDRELATIRRFLDDLRNVVKPKPVERFAMEMNASIADIVESMKPEGDRHGIMVAGQYSPGPLVIEGDRFALGRVFRNLITNAIQATAPGGSVIVSTARRNNQVEISVADTGSGIASDRLAAIFDDFVTTKRRGLGLGLAISKRIVEQLDGTIAVASELGRGTSFTLRFPARDDLAAQAAAS